VSRSRRETGSVLGVVAAVGVTLLRPWPDNPRRISGERLEALKQSMVADPAMLWARPLLALRDGTVFSGNQRLRVALELGWESIPVLYVDLEWDRARTWALRDNAAYGEWDEPALAELLAELAAEGIDLILTGLTGGDIDRILAGIPTPVEPDQAPELPTGPPESRPGEVYELGNHRLLCGDARSTDDLAALIETEKVELVLTDPPYGVSYTGKTRAELTIRNDGQEGLEPLLMDAFAAINPFLAPAARFYVFAPAGPLGTVFRRSIDTAGWQLHQSLVWVKDAIVLGHSDYHYRHEDILFGRTPGPGRPGRGRRPGSRWYGGNGQGSVFFVDRPRRSLEHPTIKPVELLSRMLRNSTRRGDIVLDPFAGSGSTLIACEQLGRRCYAVEPRLLRRDPPPLPGAHRWLSGSPGPTTAAP
jgi:DNA modification methylase